MKIALDVSVRSGKASSFQRVSTLHEKALVAVGCEPIFWTGGDMVAEILWSPWMDVSAQWSGPSIGVLHDVSPLLRDNRQWLERQYRSWKFKRDVTRASKRASAFAAVSQDVSTRFSHFFQEIDTPVAVVPHFAPPGIHKLEDEKAMTQIAHLGIWPKFVLFVGALRMHKNWVGLLKAWEILQEKGNGGIQLVLAGSTHRATRRLRKFQEQDWFESTVKLIGHQNDGILNALYSQCRCFVFPSFNEGFGLPPLEAMTCGAPVVASGVTAIPEVLGEAATYFQPENHSELAIRIRDVLVNPNLRREMRLASLDQASKYSPERTGEAMLNLSRQVLGL